MGSGHVITGRRHQGARAVGLRGQPESAPPVSRWLDIFHETPVADGSVSANSANSANSSRIRPIGTNGTIGTGELLAKWGELAPVVEWFLASTPPSEPFQLMPGVTILAPTLWWKSLRMDIAAGPGTRRDRYGAVRGDLRRLHSLLG